MAGSMVDWVTNDMLIGPDWAKNMEICDICNRDLGFRPIKQGAGPEEIQAGSATGAGDGIGTRRRRCLLLQRRRRSSGGSMASPRFLTRVQDGRPQRCLRSWGLTGT